MPDHVDIQQYVRHYGKILKPFLKNKQRHDEIYEGNECAKYNYDQWL